MLAIPNGANPPGIFESLNLALRAVAGAKVPSKASTVAQRKLVAYRNTPVVFTPDASPLYTAPVAPLAQVSVELSTFSSAVLVGGLVGKPSPRFQAEIVPSSVAKMKIAGLPSFFRLKANEVLATMPVGADVPVPEGVGIITAKAGFAPKNPVPSPLYRADMPEPLSFIQNGPPGKKAIPHEFSRVESWWSAGTVLVSETRSCRTYPFPCFEFFAQHGKEVARPASSKPVAKMLFRVRFIGTPPIG